MRADRLRVILAALALTVVAAVLHGPASAHTTSFSTSGRAGSSTFMATVDGAPPSHVVEPRDDGIGNRAKALRGPVLFFAVLVALLEAARRGGRSARLLQAGARHRSERWTVSLRGPPSVFS